MDVLQNMQRSDVLETGSSPCLACASFFNGICLLHWFNVLNHLAVEKASQLICLCDAADEMGVKAVRINS